MHSLQIEIIMFLRAYMLCTDEEWHELFGDCPESQAYANGMWTRMRVMASGRKPVTGQVAFTHKAICLNCGTVYDRWPNEYGVDMLRQCFAKDCGGYADTHWEATLLGRIMLYG